jgi:hypothetical protein
MISQCQKNKAIKKFDAPVKIFSFFLQGGRYECSFR